MLSLCPLLSRLSLAARTGANRILNGKDGIGKAKRTFSVKDNIDDTVSEVPIDTDAKVNILLDKDDKSKSRFTISLKEKVGAVGDDGSGESQSSRDPLFLSPQSLQSYTFSVPRDFAVSEPSAEDFNLLYEWTHTSMEKDTFLGGRHGRMVQVDIKRLMEVPSGVLPCSVEEGAKEEMYRLHLQDPEYNNLDELAKAYGTSFETVYAILAVRDGLNFSKKITLSRKLEMLKLHSEKPEIYTFARLAKENGVAMPSVHRAMFLLGFNADGS